MALADLQADGDYKLILADLGTGTSVIKLKVQVLRTIQIPVLMFPFK